MRFPKRFTLLVVLLIASSSSRTLAQETRDISRAALLDRIHGSWTGMLIGGLEGLPHEFKYNDKPRETLPDFPFLPQGARTDDDNDFEWVHLFYMDKEGTLKLPPARIAEIWKANMNTGIWVANKRARELMDQGILPPATGDPKNNKHATYNLSGQFCVESYGMIAPGMPQAAADLGMYYTHIAVSGEPIQAAQFWSTLISLGAFDDRPLPDVIRAAGKACDPRSAMAQVIQDALKAHHEHPDDWKAARQYFHEVWLKQKKWNTNSTPLNGAMVLLALLYGNGDFYKTLQYAMALGYDADCNAATAGAVIGYRIGYSGLKKLPGFAMPDRFLNKTRPALPAEVKVSEQAEMMLRVAERVITSNGGEKLQQGDQASYRIKLQEPKNLEPLPQ